MPVTINGTTGIAGVDGSASTPAVQGSDTNTGIFFPAADTIAFGEGGAEAMRIDSSGNVGIGTSSPSRILSLYNATAPYLALQNSTTGTTSGDGLQIFINGSDGSIFNEESGAIRFGTAGSERMRINSSGNVGINTTSPSYQLQIKGSDNSDGSTYFRVYSNNETVWTGIGYQRIETSGSLSVQAAGNINIRAGGSTETARFDSSGNFLFNSGYGSVATAYGCRSWVNFNGTGTVSIRASGNVSSITDNGTGDYTVNFSTAMTDANYAGVSGMTNDGSTGTNNPRVAEMVNTSSSAMRMLCMDSASGTAGDMNSVYVAIFR